MQAAADAAVERMEEGAQEFEELASYAAADVIFRTLFSIPITHDIAAEVFQEFRTYQRAQPILNRILRPLSRCPVGYHGFTVVQRAVRLRVFVI